MLRRLTTPTPIDLAQLEAKILGRQAGMHWYTLIIEPQSWRRVAERAGEMGYATYCPMKREPALPLKSGRKTVSAAIERPLMPGYLFVDMPGPRRRFDLFTPSNDPGDRPEELPQGELCGYVADCARPSVEPVLGCRGFITVDGGPVALHEAVIDDMRLREGAGEFDLTGLSEDGGRVAKWVKRGVPVDIVGGLFAGFPGMVEEVESSKFVKVEVQIFGRSSSIPMSIDWIRRSRRAVVDEKLLILGKKRRRDVSQSSAALG